MRKYATVMALGIWLAAGSALADGPTGNAAANARLDAKGDRIEDRLDARGDRIDSRLDARAAHAAEHGRDGKAARLDAKGDRIDHRLDHKGARIERRLDKRGNRIDRRRGGLAD